MALGPVLRYGRRAAALGTAWQLGQYVGKRVREVAFPKSSSRRVKRRRRSSKRKSSSSRASGSRSRLPIVSPVFDGAGGTMSSAKQFLGRNRISRVMRSVGTPGVFSYNAAARLTSAVGAQQAYIVLDIGDAIDLTNIIGYYSGGVAMKALYKGGTAESLFTNQEKGNVRMTLYDLVCKRDVTVADQATKNPLSAWTTGVIDENNTSVTTPARTNLGTVPTDSAFFNQIWKVKKVTKVILPQGGSHTHKVYISGGRWLNEELTSRYQYLRGVTHLTVAVVHGMPLNDQTTKTNVNVGIGAVDHVSIVRLRHQGFYGTNMRYNYDATGLPAITTAYVMDKGSGEPEADANA